ncbi:hypothetical protein V6N12_073525 [Hibiscus sabdariffa]|uniref:Uncharacterized protein n=1 Tax=Hibiscus sabdariffa TaxID=183260 RepID=A0ABR2BHC3_9ROSI
MLVGLFHHTKGLGANGTKMDAVVMLYKLSIGPVWPACVLELFAARCGKADLRVVSTKAAAVVNPLSEVFKDGVVK